MKRTRERCTAILTLDAGLTGQITVYCKLSGPHPSHRWWAEDASRVLVDIEWPDEEQRIEL